MDGLSTTRKDYKWPYSKPLTFKPTMPPMKTKPVNFYMKRPEPGYCHCDTHQYDAEMNQYKALAKKENILLEELYKLSKKTTQLSNGILDHPCDDDDTKMESIYQTDYKKRGYDIPKYQQMMAAVDSKALDPVKRQKIGLLDGYRDPTSFRYTAILRPSIDTPLPVTFKTTPETVIMWHKSLTERSEYQDTISKTGVGIIKSRQQYMEPLPSSRRRFGDPCL